MDDESFAADLAAAAAVVRRDLAAYGLDPDEFAFAPHGARGLHIAVPGLDEWHSEVFEGVEADRMATVVADHVQKIVMDDLDGPYLVWPLCAEHQLGLHAVDRDGVPAWTCNGGGGHFVAPIGGLASA